VAASQGHIDELVAPIDTRARLAWAFGSLSGQTTQFRKAG
jgi:hypothetical protein